MKAAHLLSVLVLGASVLWTPPAGAQDPFSYHDPGDLIPGSGTGLEEWEVFAPGMRFPMTDGPAYANSQVYMHGGYLGPGGGQCEAPNYSFPWRDNYCESRSWSMPLCPSGQGHQGQDIRPATCDDAAHGMAAAATGNITNIGSYSVYLTTPDGTRFDYLHGSNIAVNYGQGVDPGDHIGMVSNEFGGGATTIHLHYNIKQDVGGVGFVYVSPYMSLVESYKELMGLSNAPPQGALDETDCQAITGWAHDPDLGEAPVTVRLHLDGEPGSPDAIVIDILADEDRPELCGQLGSCAHGFTLEAPRSLMDGQSHPVHAEVADDEGGDAVQLEASPLQFNCAPPALPDGVRRHIESPEVIASWGFSPLWDMANVDDPTLEALPEGPMLGESPLLVASENAPDTVWLIDQGLRRAIESADVMEAWRFDPQTIQLWPADSVDGVEIGTALRPAPFLVKGEGPEIYLLDDEQCEGECEPGDGDGGPEDEGGTGGDGALPPGFGDDEANGCGCTSSDPAGAWLLVMVFAAGFRRRGSGGRAS